MNPKDVIRQVIEGSDMILRAYVSDLGERDLMVRSVPGTNHIAWQLGHMIGGTAMMIGALGRAAPQLPPGFAEAHGKETASCDDPSKFFTKEQYLDLLDRTKAAALAAVDATPEGDLEKPGPESMREYAPTVSAVLLILGQHWLMHAGQFVPIRRKLGKPPLF
ncbi:MAG: DinB family protein [Phycisphaerales bacterium]|jgi:hypothetical protein